ncbi:DUF72 domain-containing protein [Marinoscillum sp. MHG1-6]|uniref:DUF72 domain-containing protein n=1 Tax=Marinoscillum sp. MHG1-6 TaxID=2959627 RepID=UPI0021572C83|nr:DUF72 domain-containing protein [Marinoscillum sp. MHG1-6]
MKFGKVDDPSLVDFTLPADHPDTAVVLYQKGGGGLRYFYVGCAKWNKQDLKGFYPRGTKDELAYYASQFNSIELNATFYSMYGPEQIEKWKDKTGPDFVFFPKVNQTISHFKRLLDVEKTLEEYCENTRSFGDQLGMIFLQLHDNFSPKNRERVEAFLEMWPKDLPLAVEMRHTDWFNDQREAEWIYHTFENHGVANIITDTAGRRDLLHMRLTSPVAFVRYVGANHSSDYTRLDDWIERIKIWKEQGLEKLYFFVHQNLEKASPLLSTHFIKHFNAEFGTDLKVPASKGQAESGTLF